MFISRPGKVLEKIILSQRFWEKSWNCCYIQMFIYAEFEIINVLKKEKRMTLKI